MTSAPSPAPPPTPPRPAREGLDPYVLGMIELGLVGALAGAALGYLVFRSWPGSLLMAVAAAGLAARMPERVGRMAGSVFFGSGNTTPAPDGHSLARSLAAQGFYDAALAEFEAGIRADPNDPEPYVEIARLCRDRLDRPADALAWLRRARRARRVTSAQDALIIRELTALCADRLHEPLRAAPELAQLAAARAGTPDGDWARRELERIRAEALTRDGSQSSRTPRAE